MKCPNCGSENCQYITTTETHGGGISWGDACCGTMLLGPVGILCGFCGSEVHTRTKEYWICNSCGRRFSQSEAERVMQDEAKRIKEFRFYLEMQEKFGSTNAKTDLGERIKQGEKLFLSPVFTDKELISSNPFIEDERLESIKYGITEVLTKEDLVYLVMPDMRIVFADKSVDSSMLNIGKNEIYARHGYIFADENLKQYFEEKLWYKGEVTADQFDENQLNSFEKKNIELINTIEAKENQMSDSTDTQIENINSFVGEEGTYYSGNVGEAEDADAGRGIKGIIRNKNTVIIKDGDKLMFSLVWHDKGSFTITRFQNTGSELLDMINIDTPYVNAKYYGVSD